MSTTKKVAKPTQTKTTTKKATRAKKVDATQKAEVVKQTVESKRVIKYNYPTDCKDTVKRKAFRQAARTKIRRLENKIFKAQSKTSKAKFEKELKTYKADVLN